MANVSKQNPVVQVSEAAQTAPAEKMADLVAVENNQPVTTSLKIAEVFGKQHKHVLEAIKSLDCSEKFRETNFRPSKFTYSNGNIKKQLPMYHITRDGFMFLVMGFTGKTAAKWKEAFIGAFNDMEAKLQQEARFKLENEIIGYRCSKDPEYAAYIAERRREEAADYEREREADEWYAGRRAELNRRVNAYLAQKRAEADAVRAEGLEVDSYLESYWLRHDIEEIRADHPQNLRWTVEAMRASANDPSYLLEVDARRRAAGEPDEGVAKRRADVQRWIGIVEVVDGTRMISSATIAKLTGRSHRDVVARIRSLFRYTARPDLMFIWREERNDAGYATCFYHVTRGGVLLLREHTDTVSRDVGADVMRAFALYEGVSRPLSAGGAATPPPTPRPVAQAQAQGAQCPASAAQVPSAALPQTPNDLMQRFVKAVGVMMGMDANDMLNLMNKGE